VAKLPNLDINSASAWAVAAAADMTQLSGHLRHDLPAAVQAMIWLPHPHLPLPRLLPFPCSPRCRLTSTGSLISSCFVRFAAPPLGWRLIRKAIIIILFLRLPAALYSLTRSPGLLPLRSFFLPLLFLLSLLLLLSLSHCANCLIQLRALRLVSSLIKRSHLSISLSLIRTDMHICMLLWC
jgi:hypothetical protein